MELSVECGVWSMESGWSGDWRVEIGVESGVEYLRRVMRLIHELRVVCLHSSSCTPIRFWSTCLPL